MRSRATSSLARRNESTMSPDAALTAAEARFQALTTYQLTLRSHPADGDAIELRYSFRKPGFIRMDFVRPHAGATLIYSPETRTARVWPFGFPRFPSLALDPDNPMIRGPHGHRVDQSDMGTLLRNVRALGKGGVMRIDGAHLVVDGASARTVAGVHRYRLRFDPATSLPIEVVSEDEFGALIESVTLDALRIDITFPQDFFV